MLFEVSYVTKDGKGRIGYVNAKTAFDAKSKAMKNTKVAKVENVSVTSPVNRTIARGAMLDSAMITLDEIKSKYGVTQSDASGNLSEAIMGISNACANAKRALQKATKYISDPRLKTLNTRLTAAFNAIDSFNAEADALNDKLIGFRK